MLVDGCSQRFAGGGLSIWLWVSVCLLVQLEFVHANWMYLSMVSASISSSEHNHQGDETCEHVPGLVMDQLRMCKSNPGAMPCVGLGASMGLQECVSQFNYERWNCSVWTPHTGSISPVIEKGTKETAFLYAVTSAGVVHALTKSCSAGNLTECSCDTRRQGQPTKEGWKWGGCSDNIDYGIWFSRTFVDAPERVQQARDKRDVKPLMNLHNNDVGRRAVAANMQLKCRCHGVSGSCGVKTCWTVMPSFHQVGSILKEKYDASTKLQRNVKKELRKRRRRSRRKAKDDLDLVYVSPSPDFCDPNPRKGIPGTHGRECKKDGKGPESCDLLCCGRGYNTIVERSVVRCECKFVWCCEVICKSCLNVVEKNYCK